jgi:hypothetical protein
MLTSSEREAATLLSLKTIREVTNDLASKQMEGRGTAQPGADRAAKYLADTFARIGLKPLGDSSTYQQRIKFKVETPLPEYSFKVGDTVLKFRKDFAPVSPFPAASKDVTGGLVLVGYGVVSDEIKRNDLAGIDVKDKMVVVLSGKPNDADPELWDKVADQELVFERLIGMGAAGFVITEEPTEDGITMSFPVAATSVSRRRVSLADAPGMPIAIPPIILISDSTAEKILARPGRTFAQLKQAAEAGEFVSTDLKLPASISARVKREEGDSNNVIGVIEGSDARLKDEAIVYTAHYDAFGIDYDGTVYPGAADNALGVGKLIALAEVFAHMKTRPRRSIIFISATGEEYGDLGVEYWLKHPTWPIEKLAANINYDGIGTEVWGKLGSIVDLRFTDSDLDKLVKGATRAVGVKIIPDQWPDVGIFYRSDHYAFATRGIPALFLLGFPVGKITAISERAERWMSTDYHMATDIVRPGWTWTGVRTLAVLGLVIGMRVANKEAMPAWKANSPYNRSRGTNLPPPPR